jgi:N-acetylmuramoyl-L-alanine amidase
MAFKSNTRKRGSTDYIAVHCSATSENLDVGAKEIDKWHRAQGWYCIGYHYVIRRDGTIEEGRDREVIGAHVVGFNEVSVGICLVGGVDANDPKKAENNYTKEQFESLKKLLDELKAVYPQAKVQGHRDFPNVKKACPCFDVESWCVEQGITDK